MSWAEIQTVTIQDMGPRGGSYCELFGVVSGYTTPEIALRMVALDDPGTGDAPEVRGVLLDVAPFDEALHGAHARYDNGTTSQAIAASTDTVAAYGHAVSTHPYVTRSTDGAGHKFTFTRGGTWAITATNRFQGGSAGERYAALLADNYGSMSVVTAQGGSAATGIPETINLSYTDHFSAGQSVKAQVWQTGNTSLNLDGAAIWKNITFVLINPDVTVTTVNDGTTVYD